uniref:GrpE protein homolog n=1 Tax=Zooxanthella nutricula TaxID=1333877 RepID=A0A7S2Q7H2_9DINO
MTMDSAFISGGLLRPQPLPQRLRAEVAVEPSDGPFVQRGSMAGVFAVPGAVAAAALAMQLTASRGKCEAAARRALHVRRFFGKGQADSEEGEEEEELSEATKAALAKMQEEIDSLRVLADEKRESHNRLKVEADTFRSRTRTELANARGQAAVPVVKELLPICDEFDLAKQNLKIEGEGEQAIADRFDELFGKMMKAMKDIGVDKMEAVGQDFNPEFHEAVSMIPSAEYKDEVVCNELRAGWVLKPYGADTPQVLRPALVCVSSGPGPA